MGVQKIKRPHSETLSFRDPARATDVFIRLSKALPTICQSTIRFIALLVPQLSFNFFSLKNALTGNFDEGSTCMMR